MARSGIRVLGPCPLGLTLGKYPLSSVKTPGPDARINRDTLENVTLRMAAPGQLHRGPDPAEMAKRIAMARLGKGKQPFGGIHSGIRHAQRSLALRRFCVAGDSAEQ